MHFKLTNVRTNSKFNSYFYYSIIYGNLQKNEKK